MENLNEQKGNPANEYSANGNPVNGKGQNKKRLGRNVIIIAFLLFLIVFILLFLRYNDRKMKVKQALDEAKVTYEKTVLSESQYGGKLLADYKEYLGAFDQNADYVSVDFSYSYQLPFFLDSSSIDVKVTPSLVPRYEDDFDYIHEAYFESSSYNLVTGDLTLVKYFYEMKQALLMLESMNHTVESASKENCQIEANGYTLNFKPEASPVKLVDASTEYYMSEPYTFYNNDSTNDYEFMMEKQQKAIDSAYLEALKVQQKKEQAYETKQAENRKRKKIDKVRDEIEDQLDAYIAKNIDEKMQKELRKEGVDDVTVEHWLGSYSGKYGLIYECYWEYGSSHIDAEFSSIVKSKNPGKTLTKFKKMAEIRKKYMKNYKTKAKGYTTKLVPADTEESENPLSFELKSKDIYQSYSYEEYEDGSSELSSYDFAFSISEKGEITTADYSDDSDDSGDSSSSSESSDSASSGSKDSSKSEKKYTKTYDDGYEDIWLDGDYDEEEYKNNQDYANGVDDAMEENEDEGW